MPHCSQSCADSLDKLHTFQNRHTFHHRFQNLPRLSGKKETKSYRSYTPKNTDPLRVRKSCWAKTIALLSFKCHSRIYVGDISNK